MRMQSFLFVLLTSYLAMSIVAQDNTILASFERPDSTKNWVSINDGVMGGRSKGGFERTKSNTLLFSGRLSLENNGGFASIRTKPRSMGLAGTAGIVVKARGDGRTYWVELRAARQRGATSYRAYLPTSKGEWTETRIPLSEFRAQAFGRPVPGASPLDPAAVQSVGFMLADKKEGTFELEIEYVNAVTENTIPQSADGGKTIVDVAAAAGTFKTLLAAASAADLAGALAGEGPFTVLAPTDEAFSRLPAGTVEELLKPENKEKLSSILKYHVIAGRATLAKAIEVGEGVTLQGSKITTKFDNGRVLIGTATLLKADIAASNGIIHVIDQVLLPPEATGKPMTPAALIELAINRGVPLFNHGNPGACAAVYEVTCEALRVMPGVSGKDLKEDLDRALEEIRTGKTSREKAWILRNALDRVFSRLAEDA